MNTEQTEKAATFLSGILSGWGIKQSWSKIIVGAILGALAAAGILTTGCTAAYSQNNADGSCTTFTGTVILPEDQTK